MTTTIWTPFTPQWFRKNFKKHFPDLDAGDYIDTLMLQAKMECHIDLMALDDHLHAKYGGYEENWDISMRDVIWLFISEEASRWVDSAI